MLTKTQNALAIKDLTVKSPGGFVVAFTMRHSLIC